MEFSKVLRKRRSIRSYKDTPVNKELIIKVLEAARIAPSGGNRQPWHFIVVQNKETIKKLAGRQEWAATAPVMILGLVDKRQQASYYYNDMGVAFEHIILKATDLGLGTCWMGMMRRSDEANKLLDIPEELEVIIQTPVGYPDETPNRRGRKTLEEIVSWEKFSN
ncbi:MAG: nitroreductase family protein [Deltaproteobacteria bacterium]|nr:nitroreductase family protein [Deltaproteobacteria bacterium]